MTNKRTFDMMLKYEGWRNITIPERINRPDLNSESFAAFVSNALLPAMKVRLKTFRAHRDLKNLHFTALKYSRDSLLSLDIRGTKLSEKTLLEYFTLNCSLDCDACDGIIHAKHKRPLQHLDVSNMPYLTDIILEKISIKCPNMKTLNLSQLHNYKFTDYGIQKFMQGDGGQSLVHLSFSGCQGLTDKSLNWIAKRCQNLRFLDCSGAFHISSVGVKNVIESLVNLEEINISYCWRVTDHGFSSIGRSGMNKQFGMTIKKIELDFCYQISDISIQRILFSPFIQHLSIKNCPYITEEMKEILQMKGIQVLEDD
ncbi:Dynein regulatory complex subunit 6 [Globomyces sp. JEL0801]|nr:Dynein regulatory complex subunit 6 [Globomyces sp. JEL0801]